MQSPQRVAAAAAEGGGKRDKGKKERVREYEILANKEKIAHTHPKFVFFHFSSKVKSASSLCVKRNTCIMGEKGKGKPNHFFFLQKRVKWVVSHLQFFPLWFVNSVLLFCTGT